METRRAMTYEEQIETIRKKGFVIYGDEEADSIEFLKKVNYYRLSAYFLPYLGNGKQTEKEISFYRIRRVYEFDSRIRAFIFELIEDIEVSLRTQLSYYVSQKYGAFGHLREEMYSPKHNERSFQNRVKACVEKNRRSPVIQQSEEKHDGKIPLWIIIEFFSMGMLSYFYSDMKSQDQKQIAGQFYNTGVKQLESWLHCLTDLRNRCAHYLRLYYWSFASLPRMPKDHGFQPDRRLFTQLMVLKFLYPDRREWNFKISEVMRPLTEEYRNDIDFEHIGFPEDWEAVLTE